MQVVLAILLREVEKCSFSIVRGKTVIGRAKGCDLRIPLSRVSRRHCELVRDGDNLSIHDLGSKNGTFHNGLRVKRAELSAGDRIGCGPVTLLLRIDGQPPESESVAGRAAAVTGVGMEQITIEPEDEPDELIDLNADSSGDGLTR